MKLLLGVPTLERADLLNRFYHDLCSQIGGDDLLIILDNGRGQEIKLPSTPNVLIERAAHNMGVSGSWNWFLRRAFVQGDYDGCILLHDDIIWNTAKVERARDLLRAHPDVDLFLSYSQFSVQVHRPSNVRTVGFFDEVFGAGWCDDDDYALQMIHKRPIYQRFHSLDPLPGSAAGGTAKQDPFGDSKRKLADKWGEGATKFGINARTRPYYETNRRFLLRHDHILRGEFMLRLRDEVVVERVACDEGAGPTAGALRDLRDGRLLPLNGTAMEILATMLASADESGAVEALRGLFAVDAEALRQHMTQVTATLRELGMVRPP